MATPLQQALQQVGNQIVAQMKANLQRNNNNNTGELSNSIKATVTDNKLVITMLDYGQWVNNGKERGPGRKPPIKAIQFWIAKNGITPRGGITAKQLPFVIQRGIGKRGQVRRRAFPFIQPAVDTVIKQDLPGIFNKAIKQEIETLFKAK
jgi:hypothetical protein